MFKQFVCICKITAFWDSKRWIFGTVFVRNQCCVGRIQHGSLRYSFQEKHIVKWFLFSVFRLQTCLGHWRASRRPQWTIVFQVESEQFLQKNVATFPDEEFDAVSWGGNHAANIRIEFNWATSIAFQGHRTTNHWRTLDEIHFEHDSLDLYWYAWYAAFAKQPLVMQWQIKICFGRRNTPFHNTCRAIGPHRLVVCQMFFGMFLICVKHIGHVLFLHVYMRMHLYNTKLLFCRDIIHESCSTLSIDTIRY